MTIKALAKIKKVICFFTTLKIVKGVFNLIIFFMADMLLNIGRCIITCT